VVALSRPVGTASVFSSASTRTASPAERPWAVEVMTSVEPTAVARSPLTQNFGLCQVSEPCEL
jgi:hypothetical protein